ncbi:MAG: M48 family metalloprotease [Candidatus Thorarchaeota archaeon]
MTVADFFLEIWTRIQNWDITTILGIVLAVIGLFFLVNEIRTKIKYGTTSENLMLAFIALTFGLVLVLITKWLLAIALSFFVLAVYQTIQLRESPVWRELMIVSVVTYLVFLVGTVGDYIFEKVTGESNEIFTGWAYNLMIFVFIIMALIFFGKKFVLVSRLMSPQILYLVLFALVYVVLYLGTNILSKTNIIEAEKLNWFYLSSVLDQKIAERVIFLSIAPYEVLILISFVMYFISGPLLTKLLGIKPVEDERILKIVEEIRVRLGIKNKVKVGFVEAPILNAMAYGPWFDQRIAFISRELSDFTDDDIKGIVTHELAHNKRLHVVWLQVIASAEMIIKKALLLPATTLDYAAYPQDIPFAIYFLINYGILAFLFIFVRILEGDADLQTKKVGYGKELAQVLYKLEGFYQGIAGDFGLNVQLLTGKEFTDEEKQRFRGEAAIRLYRHIYRPGRWDMISNIFMSHPRSAYRIVAVLEDDFSPVKGALLPYWLVLPDFIRRKAIKQLTNKREQFSKLITEKYNEYYGEEGVKDFLELTRMEELVSTLKGRYIIAYDHIAEDIVIGEVEGIHISKTICQPLLLRIKTQKEEKQILITDYAIADAQKGDLYVLKNGRLGTLTSWDINPKNNKPTFLFETLTEEKRSFKTTYTGKNVDYFNQLVDKNVIFYKDGLDRDSKMKSFELGTTFHNTAFVFEVDNSEKYETIVIGGNELIIDLPPILMRLDKDKMKYQHNLLKSLIGDSVILFTKEELEIGIACEISEVTDETLKYKIKDKISKIEKKKIDYIYLYADVPKFMMKKHISLFDRFLYWLSNRREMKYIFG